MASMICEVMDVSSQEPFKTVAVTTAPTDKGIGNKEFLQVPRSFIQKRGKVFWFPVIPVEIDTGRDAVLIQLPFEADSGANRVWVPLSSMLQSEEIPA